MKNKGFKFFLFFALLIFANCGPTPAEMLFSDGSNNKLSSFLRYAFIINAKKSNSGGLNTSGGLVFSDTKQPSKVTASINIKIVEPANFTASINVPNKSITLKWNAGTGSDSTKISNYEVSKDDGTNWVNTGNHNLTHTFTGLTLGNTYKLKVRAKYIGDKYSNSVSLSRYLGSPFKNFTLGMSSSFIETTDNKLFVFGDNSRGQLGLGDTTNRTKSVEFTDSRIKGKVKKVTLSPYRSFIETTDNKLFVFGENGRGQLGLGDTTNRTTPVEFTDSRIRGKVKKVTLSYFSSFIETTDNKLFLFGENGRGQLGLGDTTNRTTPVEFTDSRIKGKVKKVTLGISSSFIETTDNKLFVFGKNSSGQLGLGNWTDRNTPVEFTDSRIRGKVKKVTSGADYCFIETTDNKLFIFGKNSSGQLGLGDTNDRNTPVELTDSRIQGKVKKVTLGMSSSFVETTDNKLFVFGSNSNGELGLGDTNRRTSPVELTDSRIQGKVNKVALGMSYSLIETTDNKLFVFGKNTSGQLGLGDTTDRTTPVELTKFN